MRKLRETEGDVVLLLGFSLVHNSDAVGIHDVEELLLSAEYAPFRRRSRPRGTGA